MPYNLVKLLGNFGKIGVAKIIIRLKLNNRFDKRGYLYLNERYELSGVRYQVSGIRYQVSGIRYEVSNYQL